MVVRFSFEGFNASFNPPRFSASVFKKASLVLTSDFNAKYLFQTPAETQNLKIMRGFNFTRNGDVES